jgi:flagellar biogenesis protein FliO
MKQKRQRTFAQQEAMQVIYKISPYIIMIIIISWILVKR